MKGTKEMNGCTGMCRTCGKCLGRGNDDRKAAMMIFPPDLAPDLRQRGLGAAIDMGTTTIAVTLWDLGGASLLAGGSCANPQIEYGADVISRITFCSEQDGGARLLRQRILEGINDKLRELCAKAGRGSEEIISAAVCGNTTMSHIFAGFSPVPLAKAPFTPQYDGTLTMYGRESGLTIHKNAMVNILPNLGGHVGGDITAGLLAVRFMEQRQLTLYIDIGTNGELALTDGSTVCVCSTSAGPALEGAGIKWGMKAGAGAIERVRIESGTVKVQTIGGGQPTGICGSGVIDAVAQMLSNGLLTARGRLVSKEDALPDFRSRIEEQGKSRSFVLCFREQGAPITITQEDIRQFQLAKAAIQAGSRMLLSQMGKGCQDIHKILVAGAFGSHIDMKNALITGILPEAAEEKIVFMGNAAGAGTAMALLSAEEMEKAERMPSRIRQIDLAGKKAFQKLYLASMNFSSKARAGGLA